MLLSSWLRFDGSRSAGRPERLGVLKLLWSARVLSPKWWTFKPGLGVGRSNLAHPLGVFLGEGNRLGRPGNTHGRSSVAGGGLGLVVRSWFLQISSKVVVGLLVQTSLRVGAERVSQVVRAVPGSAWCQLQW